MSLNKAIFRHPGKEGCLYIIIWFGVVGSKRICITWFPTLIVGHLRFSSNSAAAIAHSRVPVRPSARSHVSLGQMRVQSCAVAVPGAVGSLRSSGNGKLFAPIPGFF